MIQKWYSEPWKPYVKQMIDDSTADSESIGFTAYRSTDQKVKVGSPILFNQVLTNEGGGYSSYNGIFKCPKDGVYVFSFSVCVLSGQAIDAELVVSSGDLLNAYVKAPPHTYVQAGNTAVVRMKKNDYAKVRHNPTHQSLTGYTYVEGSSTMRLTSFTGFLLHA